MDVHEQALTEKLFLPGMIRFFKSPQPATLVIIPVIILVFWGRFFLDCQPVTDANSLPLWIGLAQFLSGLPSWFNWIILFLVIVLQAVYFNLMVNRHEVLYKSSFLPAFIFALFISATPSLMILHPVHLINLLALLMMG